MHRSLGSKPSSNMSTVQQTSLQCHHVSTSKVLYLYVNRISSIRDDHSTRKRKSGDDSSRRSSNNVYWRSQRVHDLLSEQRGISCDICHIGTSGCNEDLRWNNQWGNSLITKDFILHLLFLCHQLCTLLVLSTGLGGNLGYAIWEQTVTYHCSDARRNISRGNTIIFDKRVLYSVFFYLVRCTWSF